MDWMPKTLEGFRSKEGFLHPPSTSSVTSRRDAQLLLLQGCIEATRKMAPFTQFLRADRRTALARTANHATLRSVFATASVFDGLGWHAKWSC